MKHHGLLLSVLLAALLLLGAGCNTGKVTPTPTIKPNPTVNPTINPTVNPTTDILPSGSPGTETIEGFKEGETVEVSALPEKVTKAVKDKYPDATIKSATYATYMDKQMFHLMLEGTTDNTTEVYAEANGTLMPFNAQSTPGTTGGGTSNP